MLALPALATPSVTMEEAATSPACVSLLVLHIGNGHDFLVLLLTHAGDAGFGTQT